MNPTSTGLTLAVTLAVSYSVCAAIYVVAPGSMIAFFNALFHGLDFNRLVTSTPFSIGMFFMPLVVFVVWGLLVGALFAVVHNLIARVTSRG